MNNKEKEIRALMQKIKNKILILLEGEQDNFTKVTINCYFDIYSKLEVEYAKLQDRLYYK